MRRTKADLIELGDWYTDARGHVWVCVAIFYVIRRKCRRGERTAYAQIDGTSWGPYEEATRYLMRGMAERDARDLCDAGTPCTVRRIVSWMRSPRPPQEAP